MSHHDALQPSLTALRAFTVVGRLHNLTQAATELGISKSAVSQHIGNLEQTLKIKLFIRKGKELHLTEQGQSYLKDLRRAFDLIDHSTQRLALNQTEWVISCTQTFAECWLIPKLESLQTLVQGSIRIVTSVKGADLLEEGIDLLIQKDTPPFSIEHTAHLLFHRDWVLVCHKSLYEQYHQQLMEKNHRQMTFIGDDLQIEKHIPDLSAMIADMRFIRMNTSALAIHACLNGLGMCLIDRVFIREHLQRGELQVLDSYANCQQDACYLIHDKLKPLSEEILTWFKQQH